MISHSRASSNDLYNFSKYSTCGSLMKLNANFWQLYAEFDASKLMKMLIWGASIFHIFDWENEEKRRRKETEDCGPKDGSV